MSNIWDNVVASASKAATQAGKATETAATKAKLHADLLVIDRDIHARKEKFGVEMYAHLESITSTQEFYVADDRLINVIRPTLIKAQREVAAYERKRDAMRGKANMAEANRSGMASIFGAATIGEKLMNAAKYAAAGAKEAATKTELAMLERQILGFKEEFGVELYPIFESMEDNEGWLPTDRKVRSLYDGAREDIATMIKSKEEKREQIKQLDGLEGTGLTPPTIQVTPTVVATPVVDNSRGYQPNNNGGSGTGGVAAQPWASTAPTIAAIPPSSMTNNGGGYGSSQAPPAMQTASYGGMEQIMTQQQQQQQPQSDSGFGFMQSQPTSTTTMPQYATQQQPAVQQQQQAQKQSSNFGTVFDPFDGIAGSSSNTGSSFSASSFNNAPSSGNAFDPFSGNTNNNNAAQGTSAGKNPALSDADMGLFGY